MMMIEMTPFQVFRMTSHSVPHVGKLHTIQQRQGILQYQIAKDGHADKATSEFCVAVQEMKDKGS